MKKKPTRIVELIIEESNKELAIDAISLVSAPAIEQDFVFFGKEKHNLTFAKVDEEKRMLVSPALIPNKQIFRYDPQTDSEYYVYFSPDTVRQASELYLKHNNHHKATYEHQERVSGVFTTESWIKEGDMDKSKMYGFDLPNGTWFVKMRINNDELWNKIKEGELRGLSIEGYFVDKMQKMSNNQPTDHEILSALNEIIRETNKPQKVELALDDYAKFTKEVKSIGDKIENEADNIIDRIEKLSKDARSIVKDGYKEIADVSKTVNKLHDRMLKGVRDLGIDGKPFFSEYNKFADAEKESKENLKNLESYLKRQL